MDILHLNTWDTVGGAARAAYRLHTGLARLGNESIMLVEHRASLDPAVMAFRPPVDPGGRVRRWIRRARIAHDASAYRSTRPSGYELFTDDRSAYGASLVEELPDCDVVNLHWIAGFVDYGAVLPQLPAGVPVVWTLHDMNIFTGGCHYNAGCDRYVDRCGSCPQLGSFRNNDLSRDVWQRKNSALEAVRARMHVVADSRWLASEARRSSLFAGVPVTTIHYGLDTDVFAPRDRAGVRAMLGIPRDANVVMFVAESTANPRKGFGLLIEAIAGLKDIPNLFLLSLGRNPTAVPDSLPHLHLGHIDNDRLLSALYSAADVFVIPSLQEAFGQTALEAMACGVPVVGFEVGGIPDMVRPGVTGLLAARSDVSELRCGIADILVNPELRIEMSANCRQVAVHEFGLELQARAYIELYTDLIARGSSFCVPT